jgi:hypothetical protein
MKGSSKLLVGLILSVLALGLIVPQATASIHYRRGIGIGVNNDDEGISFQRPGNYRATLMVVMYPLWYFVDGLDTYDTVTMTLTLQRYKMMTSGNLPVLFGDNCVLLPSLQGSSLQCTWSNVHLTQDEDGVTLDATLYLGLDVIVGPSDGIGLYHLTFDGIATAPGVIFEGHTFATLLVYA